MFRRIHWNNRGCKSIIWRCISRLEPTGQECHARTVNETVLENVVVQAINTLRGCKSIVWRCLSRLEPTGQECHARTVNEKVLENVVVQAINTLLGDKSTYQAQLQQNIAKVIRDAQKTTADGIDEQLLEFQKELLKKANNKEAYDEIVDRIFKLREQRQKCTVDTAARDAQIARINDLQDFIKEQRTDLAEFDETLVKR